jgi:nitroreductase
VRLYKLFHPPRTVAGTLGVIDFHKHTATLIAVSGPIQLSRPAPRQAAAAPAAPAWILQRRSIRAYTDAPVSEQQAQALLEAAMAAPSAHDTRPWAFVLVRDPARRQAMASLHRWTSMCAQAPLVVAVLGDPMQSEHWIEDCSAATENLLLAAASLELGSVWVGIYPNEEWEAAVRAEVGAPEPWRVLCLLPVGHPAEGKPPRTRFETGKVHVERWGSGLASQ